MIGQHRRLVIVMMVVKPMGVDEAVIVVGFRLLTVTDARFLCLLAFARPLIFGVLAAAFARRLGCRAPILTCGLGGLTVIWRVVLDELNSVA